MKPSEKILEIFIKNNGGAQMTYAVDKVEAVIKYLDEEWEKNQPCKHEETQDWNDTYDLCKCGVMLKKI